MTDEQLDREAHAAIDDSVSRTPAAFHYAETVEDRDSILCRLLRAVYFAGRQHGLAQAQEIYSESKYAKGKV